jgi:hypothetical protein
MELIKEVKRNGKTLKIFTDEDPIDPRENDNLTKMVCFHKRYDLGDTQTDYRQEAFESWDELKAEIIEKEKPLVIKPLYMYDHSGITISTEPFSCRWDSGQIGWVYITNKTIDACGITIKNDETFAQYKERLEKYLEGEVNEYDQYIRGDVYLFEVTDENGKTIDGCGGFYGDDWENNGLLDNVGDEWIDAL